jgi:tRNA(fMet)-specific endonuclease VapC
MRRCLLDTGIAGDYINRRHGVFERAKEEVARGGRLGIGIPVLGELYHGIELSSTRTENLRRLRGALSTLRVWPLTEEGASEFGRLAADLQKTGRIIGKIDIQIAAIALSLGNTIVVSSDSDFGAIPGLTVENWAI